MADIFRVYELRTTDLDAARRFHAAVLGVDLGAAGGSLALAPLPARAVARGAPPHWLGHIDVPDVEASAGRLLALGAQTLGPIARTADGSVRAALRDPFGAVMALRSTSTTPPPAGPSPVAWHQLHVPDSERALAVYGELFGWTATGTMDLGGHLGAHLTFSWDGSRAHAGSVASTVGRPEVHPQWAFYFGVDDLAATLASVREHGGTALPPLRLPTGETVAYCHDPQGAVFGLHQVAAPAA